MPTSDIDTLDMWLPVTNCHVAWWAALQKHSAQYSTGIKSKYEFEYKYGFMSNLRTSNCPQNPLGCACLHTHHHQCPPNFKYLPLPLWGKETLCQIDKIVLESYYFPPKYFYTLVLCIALCKAIHVYIPPAICTVTHQTLLLVIRVPTLFLIGMFCPVM